VVCASELVTAVAPTAPPVASVAPPAPAAPRTPEVPAEFLARQAAASTPAVTPTVLGPATPASGVPVAPAAAAAPSAPELPRVAPPGVTGSAYAAAPTPSAYVNAPAPAAAPALELEAAPSKSSIPGFTPAPTILALPASLGGGSPTNAAAPSVPAPAPAPDAPHPTMAPPATVPSVSQLPPNSPAGPADGNSAHLASLGFTSQSETAPRTGPQPVPLHNDGGPLGTAPSTARSLPGSGGLPGLDLTPDNRGDFGAPLHRL
ncbi:MAG: hypothetical protein EAS51_09410, partial [Microbacteriaceae bacterium]